jgi:hypothetical protein
MFSALTLLPDEVLLPSVPEASCSDASMVASHAPTTDAPPVLALPPFSHLPPQRIHGRHRWPLSLDAQSFPSHSTPILMDVLIHVRMFLTREDSARIACTGPAYSLGPDYGPLWFTRPWSPNRRRLWGFGIPNRDRTIKTDAPLPHGFIHFVWTFLTPAEHKISARTCSQ